MSESYVTHAEQVIVTADRTTVVNAHKPHEAPSPRPGRVTVEGDADISRASDGTILIRFIDTQETRA